jgi:sulfur-oxidizing protein SoxX
MSADLYADGRRWTIGGLAWVLAGCAALPGGNEQGPLAPGGDPVRGREVFIAREAGHCVLCHAAPGIAQAGNVGPPLGGIGGRLAVGQIRYRVADITRVNPDAVMPAFHRTEGLAREAPAYKGKPVLSAQQVEDVVAWLAELR